ncbi:vacuolar ATPase assembly protein VMA12 [Lasioglossum baleicum]|uniref:vacuolar ATPase assembly protein VMA12 n=1 Tax=Lasioglossum baleicum TaxID=434251 RepID=UPI003FCC46F8
MPVESIEDPCIRIIPSKSLTEFVTQNVKKTSDAPLGIIALKKSSRDKEKQVSLKLDDIRWLNKYLENYRKTRKDKVYLHELLEGTDIRLPTPKVIPRNPELEARIKKLKAQQDAKEYQAMTKNVDSTRKHLPEDTISYQMKQINKQLIAVAQFIFSVLAGFAFGFIGVELIVGSLDFGFRLLLGIICALIIALAEIYFLAIKLNEDGYESVSTYKKLHQE